MEQYLQELLAQHQHLAFFILFFVVFFESVAVLGLLLPGTALMFSFGILIGAGQLEFWQACIVGSLACFLGDGLSYYAGRYFRPQLENWSWLVKQQSLLLKVRTMLDSNAWFAIIAGRFIGPTRPLLPLLAGMLELPPKRFFPPSLLAGIFWPAAYLLPGILAGVAWKLEGSNLTVFYTLLGASAILALLACWFLKRSFLPSRPQKRIHQPWLWSSVLVIFITGVLVFELSKHPATPIYLDELSKLML